MPRKRTAENLSSCDSDSNYDPEIKKRTTRAVGQKRKKTWVPTEKATVVLLAVNEATSQAVNLLKDVDQGVLSRIKKALTLGSHESTGEEEAKQAMRIAFRLMAQHNVNQADILASEKESEKLKRAGQSCVEIRSTKNKTLRYYRWMDYIGWAVNALFDCKYYTTKHKDRLVWTFYGLCESTVAAAYSFEMAFNLIMDWSESKRWKLIYRSGVGDGLRKFANREREEEVRRVQSKELTLQEKARAEEEEEDRRRLARLAGPPEKETEKTNVSQKKSVTIENVPDEDSDPNPPTTFTIYDYGPVIQDDEEDEGDDECEGVDDSEEEGPGADFQVGDEHEVIDVDAIDQILQVIEVKKGENKEVKREEENVEIPCGCEVKEKENQEKEKQVEEEQTPWSSKQQLILFRENATQVAEDWLKEKKITFKKRQRKNQRPKLQTKEQREMFEQGVEDAKKIDLKRKRIKEFGEE